MSTANPPTIFIYTQEQRGNQLVESPVLGMFSDVSGADKLIVAKDAYSNINFVYRIDHASSNLDAVSITDLPEDKFDGKQTTTINDMPYRLGKPEDAMRLLRGKTQWIQDKGCVLSVLLRHAANRKSGFVARGAIARERLHKVPAGVPVEYLRRDEEPKEG